MNSGELRQKVIDSVGPEAASQILRSEAEVQRMHNEYMECYHKKLEIEQAKAKEEAEAWEWFEKTHFINKIDLWYAESLAEPDVYAYGYSKNNLLFNISNAYKKKHYAAAKEK